MEHHLIAARGYFVAVGNSDLNYYFNKRVPKDSHFKLQRRITVGLFSLDFCASQLSFPSYGAKGNAN